MRQALLDTAVACADMRSDVYADDLLSAVSRLCMPGLVDDGLEQSHRMVRLLVDGLRFGVARAG